MLTCPRKINIVDEKQWKSAFSTSASPSKKNTLNKIDTFHSSFYLPLPGEVEQFLAQRQIQTKPGTTSLELLCKCPSCHKQYTNALDQVSGKYVCRNCGTSGHWADFLRQHQVISQEEFDIEELPRNTKDKKSILTISESFAEALAKTLQESKEFLNIMKVEYGLEPETLNLYGVGITSLHPEGHEFCPVQSQSLNYWVLPRYNFATRIEKTQTVTDDKKLLVLGNAKLQDIKDKSRTLLVSSEKYKANEQALFGLGVACNSKEIILTTWEMSAMALHQVTGLPSISLPKGSSQLPVQILPLLEQFQKIYLWLESDDLVNVSEKLAHKLGLGRTWICKPSSNLEYRWSGITDALKSGRKDVLLSTIEQAQRLGHKEIETFSDLREAVKFQLFNPDLVQGVQSRDFPALNKILKGHRPGELTVITGGTGVGKTTIMSQLSLDWCRWGGVPTLWGSFEVGNVRLVKRMLCQFAAQDLTKRIDGLSLQDHHVEFERFADVFQTVSYHVIALNS